MTNIKGTAIVTGATSGIGLATVERLLLDGFKVRATSRSEVGDKAITSLGALPIRCEVTDAGDRESLFSGVDDLSALVCSHGDNSLGPIEDVVEDDWRHIFDVNAAAVFFLNQSALERITDGGAIVNVSSTAAMVAVPEVALYAAAKAAVNSITRSFAVAGAVRGVRVNSIMPKIISTPMQDRYVQQVSLATGESVDDLRSKRLQGVPMGREGTAEECAAIVSFLVGDDSSYMTGQSLTVSGGWLML